MNYNYDRKRVNNMANEMYHAYFVFYMTDSSYIEDIALNRVHKIRDSLDRVLESFGILRSWNLSWNILEMTRRCAQYKVYGKVIS